VRFIQQQTKPKIKVYVGKFDNLSYRFKILIFEQTQIKKPIWSEIQIGPYSFFTRNCEPV